MNTNYEIRDEHSNKTTITLRKWDADVLQSALPNVHAWVQQAYDRVINKYPHLTRRKKGDLVRLLAANEANKHPDLQEKAMGLFL